mgnify:FL=1
MKEEISEIQIADGWPFRTVPYVQLCGIDASYGAFNYQQIMVNERLNGLQTWKDVQQLPAGAVLIQPNQNLEKGRRLEEWLPDLPCNFHYPLGTTVHDTVIAGALLAAVPQPRVGISCASYRGAEAWKTWGRTEWVDMLRRMQKEGWHPILLGGFWDDLTHAVACELQLPDLVGKTSIGEGVEVLRLLDAYVGYSSGLNVIRTVLDKPAMALWPDHQVELATSWVPPEMLTSGRYSWSLWRPVDEVWPVVRSFLTLCDQERS